MNLTVSNRKRNIIWAILFAAVLALTLWRTNFGYVSHDEAFFITIPDRLVKGDAFFTDEWQPTQLTYFITLPFVAVYKGIVGSNDGICLFMRYVYVITHTAISIVIYLRLKKYGIMSVVASVLYYMFVPGDLMSPGYDSIGVDMIALAGVLFSTAHESSKSSLLYAISGFAFALAVLCCPYLAAVYVLYFFVVLFYSIKKKADELFSWKAFAFITIGIAIPAIAFLVFVLSRATVPEILNNFKYLLMDPEHQDYSFFQKFPRYFSSIILNSAAYFWVVCVLYAMELGLLFFDKKRMEHKSAYFVVSLLLAVAGLIIFGTDLISQYFTHIMFPLVMPGFVSYVLLKNKPKGIFFGLFILGVLYSLCIYTASNQAFFVISMAFSVTNIASWIFIGLLLNEMRAETVLKKEKRLVLIAIALCVVAQAGLQTVVKTVHVFRDSSPSQLTEIIDAGPMKGIKTTEYNRTVYDYTLDDLSIYDEKESGNILILAKQPWYYLATDTQQYGTYSACIPGENEDTLEMLRLYYSENPDKIPNYIYLPKNLSWDYDNLFQLIDGYGYNISEENIMSYKFEK